jgi:hypothetical protein
MAVIDYQNEIFTGFVNAIRAAHEGVKLSSEYTRSPAAFPFISCDEIGNMDIPRLTDSSRKEKYARLQYRVAVFSNLTNGKKAEARRLLATADAYMKGLGFIRTTYTTTPDIYQSTVYSITATYEAVITAEGLLYGRES